VFLVSEACLPEQRDRIERAFRTRVFSFYGHSERLVMAGECEDNDTYHCFPDYGIAEILKEDGARCDVDVRGEIVGTGLLNRAMPLVRYRTGDYAYPDPPKCTCGRVWDRFSRVEGRWKQEMIVGRHGARISLTALNMHGPVFEKVVRYQYVQEQPGACQLRVMVTPGFEERDRLQIEQAYADKVAQEIDLSVVVVDDIPLTERGKLARLVSRLPAEAATPA
jgi:phenylacetate-CoA ligase